MVLRSVVLIVWSLGWASAVLAQAPAKTWKTLDELSAQELQTLDLRDAQIPDLPAEAYPFSPPYRPGFSVLAQPENWSIWPLIWIRPGPTSFICGRGSTWTNFPTTEHPEELLRLGLRLRNGPDILSLRSIVSRQPVGPLAEGSHADIEGQHCHKGGSMRTTL